MASTEARLQAALTELRRVNGTVAVLMLERTGEEGLVSDAQDVFHNLIQYLSGDALKEVIRMEKRCEDWRRRQDRINL